MDASFHYRPLDYSRADRAGLCDHLRDGPCKNNFNMSASTAASESESRSWLEYMCTIFVVNIRSNLIHLHSFQLPVLLASCIEILC